MLSLLSVRQCNSDVTLVPRHQARAALLVEAERATDPERIADIQTRLVDIDAVELEQAWEATGGDAGGPPAIPGGVNPQHAADKLQAAEAVK